MSRNPNRVAFLTKSDLVHSSLHRRRYGFDDGLLFFKPSSSGVVAYRVCQFRTHEFGRHTIALFCVRIIQKYDNDEDAIFGNSWHFMVPRLLLYRGVGNVHHRVNIQKLWQQPDSLPRMGFMALSYLWYREWNHLVSVVLDVAIRTLVPSTDWCIVFSCCVLIVQKLDTPKQKNLHRNDKMAGTFLIVVGCFVVVGGLVLDAPLCRRVFRGNHRWYSDTFRAGTLAFAGCNLAFGGIFCRIKSATKEKIS